jgi:hypothetical protein
MNFDPTSNSVQFNDPTTCAQAELVADGDYSRFFYGVTSNFKSKSVAMAFASRAEDSYSCKMTQLKQGSIKE